MDELTVPQAELILLGYQRKLENEWAQTQRIAYVVAQSNSKKKISPRTIVDLTQFDYSVFDEETMPDDEATLPDGDWRDRMREVADSYSRVLASRADNS